MDIKTKLKFVIKQKSTSSSSSSSSPSSPSTATRSIYRQPTSRPRSSSCSFMTARCREPNHPQPPPRTTPIPQHPQRAGWRLQYSRSADDQDYRPRAASVGSPSILKRDHLLRKLATLKLRSKHASFCESVDVVYYDDSENCLSDASSESSVCKLNDVPRDDYT
jgi:hypothetical protein